MPSNDPLSWLVRLVWRLVLVAVALVFVASLLFAMAVLGTVWALRALWARLTGQPVKPWVRRFDVRQGFSTVVQRGNGWQGMGSAPRAAADVTDVQAREIPVSPRELPPR